MDSRRPRRDGRVRVPLWSFSPLDSTLVGADWKEGERAAVTKNEEVVAGGAMPLGGLRGDSGPQPVGHPSALFRRPIRSVRAFAGPALRSDCYGLVDRGECVDHHPGPARRPSSVLHRGHSSLAVGDEKGARQLAAAAQRSLSSGNQRRGLRSGLRPLGAEKRGLQCRSC
jgi:hypothetical protein